MDSHHFIFRKKNKMDSHLIAVIRNRDYSTINDYINKSHYDQLLLISVATFLRDLKIIKYIQKQLRGTNTEALEYFTSPLVFGYLINHSNILDDYLDSDLVAYTIKNNNTEGLQILFDDGILSVESMYNAISEYDNLLDADDINQFIFIVLSPELEEANINLLRTISERYPSKFYKIITYVTEEVRMTELEYAIESENYGYIFALLRSGIYPNDDMLQLAQGLNNDIFDLLQNPPLSTSEIEFKR